MDAPRADSSCEAGPRSLCDDFEGPLGAAWTKSIGAPGDLQLSAEQHVSPSHALGMTCDFELFAETLSPAIGMNSSLVAFDMLPNVDSEAQSLSGYVYINSDSTQLITNATIDGGYAPAQSANVGALPLGSWSHYRLDVDLVSKEVSLTRNGGTFLLVTATTAFTKNNGIALTFGVAGYTLATKYFVDDVVCNLR